MASITNRNAEKYRYLGQEEAGPIAQAPTLRDKILKQFLLKQLDTSGTRADCSQKKDFVLATVEESITSQTSGLLSHKQFTDVQSQLDVKEILRSSGLSKADIKLLLSEDVDKCSLEATSARHAQLQEIERKLLERQEKLEASANTTEKFHGAVPLSRHEFEEECNTVPIAGAADKLTACLVRLEPHHDDSIPENHPINHIKELAEELFPEDKAGERDERDMPQAKRKSDTHGSLTKKKNKPEELQFKYFEKKPKSFWDMKEIPKVIGSNSINEKITDKTITIHSHGKQNMNLANKTKPFVLTLDPEDLVPLSDITSNRKTLQEIKAMEKFANYEEGEPSATLYLKNLPHKLTPKDLAAIMGHFEDKAGPRIQYRILDNRMRGQAFVTFQDVCTATKALHTCNGYILHERPMIIAFGRK